MQLRRFLPHLLDHCGALLQHLGLVLHGGGGLTAWGFGVVHPRALRLVRSARYPDFTGLTMFVVNAEGLNAYRRHTRCR